jgi:STE24 endopeptidase
MSAAVFTAYLIVLGTGYWLRYLNLTYLQAHGRTVPPEFQGVIDPALLKKISDYTIENSRAGLVESIIGNVFTVLFLFGGLLGVYDHWVLSVTGSLLWGGLLFSFILMYAGILIDIPFSLYRNFKIENRYGFNTMTMRLWLTDLLKSLAIASVLGSVVVLSALAIIQYSPAWWWLWVWTFLLVFGIFVMYISPVVIEPLFFKFEPVKAEGLEENVRVLMERAGLKVDRVFQVDASRRSRHSNAYFTGIGRVKRIVLFDTLIEHMTPEEILAVLAHEAGHWKKRHVLKRVVLTETMTFCGLFLAYHLISWTGLPGMVGLADASFFARVIILGFLSSLVMFPLTPFFSYLSRRDEREADDFASELTGRPDAMASALVKLSRENLANLHPHPLYAKFHYSHPPVVERIRELQGRGTRDDGRGTTDEKSLRPSSS